MKPISIAERLYEAAAPVGFTAVWCAALASGTSWSDLRLRRGYLPAAEAPVVWLHGASAGEITAAARWVDNLQRAGYSFTAAYTATNRAGVELARRLGGGGAVASLVPWDVQRWLARAFERWSPRLLCLVETEPWPALVLEAERRGVPVFCVSARIYARDVPRYRWIRPLIGATLRRVTAVVAQSEDERARFVALGAEPSRCFVGGNLKHLENGAPHGDHDRLGSTLGLSPEETVVVVGSLHEDEVETVLEALDPLRASRVRVVIAPRHTAAVAALVAGAARRGWAVARRSRLRPREEWRLLVLDTVGELVEAYAIARLAVIAGSFANHGGHNPVEAIAAGTPVVFGPDMRHFAGEAAALLAACPEAGVRSAAELGSRIAVWLADAASRHEALDRQRRALPDGSAVAARYLELLEPALNRALGARRR